MKLKSLFFTIFVVGVAAWGGKLAYFGVTDGFSLANISSTHQDDERWEIPVLNITESDEVEKALNQDYHYLGKGHQAYVFESADSHYVIKFLKFQKYRHHPIVQALPLPEFLKGTLKKQALHKEDKRDALFASWKIAFTKLKDETQVFFIHINRGQPFEKTLTLYNKVGMKYRLNLGDYVFMLQRKAEMFEDALARHVKNEDLGSAKALLEGLITLYKNEYKQGLFEEDRYIVRNTGVLANKPIQIDTGRLREDEAYKDPKRQIKEIVWKTSLLQEWLDENHPDLAVHFKQQLQAFEGG